MDAGSMSDGSGPDGSGPDGSGPAPAYGTPPPMMDAAADAEADAEADASVDDGSPGALYGGPPADSGF